MKYPPPPPAPTRKLRIIAQDPGVRSNGGIVTAVVDVAAETLGPGPRGYRVQIVDYDSSTHKLYQPAALPPDHDPYRDASDDALLSNPGFHAQNVYAIVMRTLARFEFALGRRVNWGFSGHQIQVAPHAFADANAFYSERDHALMFGYFPGRQGLVFSCLSHDVIAHETAHALLDGLRERYTDPSSPQQAAFHEGFSDVVALLSVFSLPGVVEAALEPKNRSRRIPREKLKPEALRETALLGLADQMGQEMSASRGDALRRSAKLRPSPDYLSSPDFQEPHLLGEVLVAAMMNAFLEVWVHRLSGLGEVAQGALDRQRVAEEGAHAANHLLTMSIRALDYCPPTDIEFRDFLSALLTADREIQPDDSKYHYRDTLLESFQDYGIRPSSKGEAGVWEPPEAALVYDRTHFESMQRDPDEVFRFIWENRAALRLCEDAYSQVQSVRPCLRLGPDGFPLRETVIEYIQMITLRADELVQMKVRAPDAMAPSAEVKLYGGGALIFDEYGRLKFHVRNSILNADRQTSRLESLWRHGYFEKGAAALSRFASLHRRRAMDLPPLRKEV